MLSSSGLPLVSVIIPCYNHGAFIEQALNSIDTTAIKYPVEIIIVDDGSTDAATREKLLQLQQQGYKIIYQNNGGPAKARNTGIAASTGSYILPLDADNKIDSDYINQGVDALIKKKYDIAYCSPVFFGQTSNTRRYFKSTPFDEKKLLVNNYIDNCAIYKREVWIANGGYDTLIPFYGHEDWEFWINALSNGFSFLYLKQSLFYYRILENSQASKFDNADKMRTNQNYILRKHAKLYLSQYKQLVYLYSRYQNDIKNPIFAAIIYTCYLFKLLRSPFNKSKDKG